MTLQQIRVTGGSGCFHNRAELALLLNEFGDKAGPAGLM
jgi:hypothetical protein